MTMNDTWGYKSYDTNWKSAETLVRNLVDIVSKGGNYLLNVGPTAEGRIPQASVDRLADVGKWLEVNGEAIYATTASPFSGGVPFGRATAKPGRIYLHVFDWPADGALHVPRTERTIKTAYLLANPSAELGLTTKDREVVIRVPASAPDRIASVVVLETN
jgi:alpha-L-fucosidase